MKGLIIRPIVLITTTSMELQNWLMTNIHGYTQKIRYYRHGEKSMQLLYSFQVARLLEIKALLEQIIPYLVIKQKQAKLVLDYIAIRLEGTRLEYDTRLFDIAKEIRELNRKSKPRKSIPF